jgi:hypothetical protein
MKIGIVGLGLIGGCLGLDLRQAGHRVYGVSRRQTTCEAAISIGAVDAASLALTSLATMDLIFVCTPYQCGPPHCHRSGWHSLRRGNHYRCGLCQGRNGGGGDATLALVCGGSSDEW